jgi:hypothetical protein
MKESSINQESNEPASEPKLFGLPRSWAGALFGILLYSLLVLLFFNAKQEAFGWAILLPGILASYSLSNTFIRTIILFGVPSLPFALCGFLIFSKSEMKKITGILALSIYFLLLMTVGLYAVVIMGDL